MTNLLRSSRALVVVGTVLALGLALLLWDGAGGKQTFTVQFASTSGLNVGDDVRVLGVRVGRVTEIEPGAERVDVTVEVDGDRRVPAEVKAAIVAPSLISGRFIQLSPAWTEGPTLESGAVVSVHRTAVPVEFDAVKEELTALATALGPDGPHAKKGALRKAVLTADENLAGTSAADLRASIANMRRASEGLSGGRTDLFATIRELNTFVSNLVVHDQAVRGFTKELSGVSDLLDRNSDLLVDTVDDLATILPELRRFVRKHDGPLTTSLRAMDVLASTLAAKNKSLADIVHVAPGAVNQLMYTVEDSAITGRVVLANLDNTAQLLCGAIFGVGGTTDTCRSALGPLVELLGLGRVPGGTPDQRTDVPALEGGDE